MFTLFIRAVLLYALVFAVLRLTGKRQVSDLQPFDLLITLLIADLAGCALSEPAVPLVYSIVPILSLYLTQQLVTWLCLKSARARRLICGSPVVIVSDGKLIEENMRKTNYTVLDLTDQLRANGIFDINEVAYAILETNGSMSVLVRGEQREPTMQDLGLAAEKAGLSQMLVLDGRACKRELSMLGLDEKWAIKRTAELGAGSIREVLFLQRASNGTLSMQKKEARRHVQ